MAAKAIQIQNSNSKKRSKSRRVRAANKFLSNISLDGSVPQNKPKREATKHKIKLRHILDKDEEEILSHPNFLDPQQRPKLLSSLSTTNAIKDEGYLGPTGSASSTTAFHKDSNIERQLYRTASLRESKHLHHNLICTSSKSLYKYKEQLRGKRLERITWRYFYFLFEAPGYWATCKLGKSETSFKSNDRISAVDI